MNAELPPLETKLPSATPERPISLRPLVVAGGLYLAVFALAAAADGAGIGRHPQRPFFILFAFIGMLMALCSVGALWWAASRWSSYAKTLPLIFAGLVCWLGLALVTGLRNTDRSGAWAIAFELHIVLAAALATVALDRLRPAKERTPQQFTILWLLLWTAVLATILGAARALTALFGWTLAVFVWPFFWHVQIFAIANGFLAASLFAAVIAELPAWQRIGAVVVATAMVATIVLAVLGLVFQQIGSGILDIVLMFAAHALFLMAALLPYRSRWLGERPAVPPEKHA